MARFYTAVRAESNSTYVDTIGSCNFGGNCTEEWANSRPPLCHRSGEGFDSWALEARLLVARTSTEPGAVGSPLIHAYPDHKPFDETQGPVILPESAMICSSWKI